MVFQYFISQFWLFSQNCKIQTHNSDLFLAIIMFFLSILNFSQNYRFTNSELHNIKSQLQEKSQIARYELGIARKSQNCQVNSCNYFFIYSTEETVFHNKSAIILKNIYIVKYYYNLK